MCYLKSPKFSFFIFSVKNFIISIKPWLRIKLITILTNSRCKIIYETWNDKNISNLAIRATTFYMYFDIWCPYFFVNVLQGTIVVFLRALLVLAWDGVAKSCGIQVTSSAFLRSASCHLALIHFLTSISIYRQCLCFIRRIFN